MALATADQATLPAGGASLFARIRAFMPAGGRLEESAWRSRHRGVLVLLWLQAAGLLAFGIYRGYDPGHVVLESSAVAAFTLLATIERFGRRGRAALATIGLVSVSGILVHFSDGYIEAHFHFFVMLGVISLYQDWLPFSLSVAYVALHHATLGIFAPTTVFNHAAGMAQPLLWASIHAVFVLGLSVANLVTWRASENAAERRERAENENRRNLSLLAATLESTADGIVVISSAGRVAGFNRRFLELWRIPQGKLRVDDDGRALANLFEQFKDPAAAARAVESIMETPEGESFDAVDLHDGRTFERYSKAQLVNGHAIGRVWSFRDVTAQRKAEADRIESVAKLAELDRLKETDEFKTRFINSAAHELNTPLTPMRIQLHLIEMDKTGQLSATQKESLKILHRNFERFDRLVQDVVNSSRIQAGRLGVTRAPMDLTKLARETVAAFEAHAQAAGISLQVDAPGAIAIEGDTERLTQVVYNLVNNALKFTPKGGTITLRVAAEAGQPTLRVVDTGSGLTGEQIEKLFRPFSQVHDTSKTRTGSGLGLYISRAIVELHGGRMWVESDGPGKGSTFAFQIAPPQARVE